MPAARAVFGIVALAPAAWLAALALGLAPLPVVSLVSFLARRRTAGWGQPQPGLPGRAGR